MALLYQGLRRYALTQGQKILFELNIQRKAPSHDEAKQDMSDVLTTSSHVHAQHDQLQLLHELMLLLFELFP